MFLVVDSIKAFQKKMNADLKTIYRWLLANKISLNVAKTELIIFRKTNMTIPETKIMINGEKFTPLSRQNTWESILMMTYLVLHTVMSYFLNLGVLTVCWLRLDILLLIKRIYFQYTIQCFPLF